MKGQGATEYLVLLGVVLIVALVAIALLGFFPGLSSNTKETQARSYWSGVASPFQITDYSYSGTTLTINVRNTRSERLTIGNITVNDGSSTVTFTPSSPDDVIGPGGSMTYSITGMTSCASGDSFEVDVDIKYATRNGIVNVEHGSKPLVGKCV
ncbi:class III signal peptide-containing protein [Candidatus Micrarchaeota archaeon]|nr:class III signal peptide-containing protein [Candidatus Micrarchaeota archaeon]